MVDEMVKPEITTDVERTREAQLKCDLIEDKPFDLTVEAAYAILELKTFAGERPVDDRHVQELYDEMANGRFRPEHVRIALCYLGADLYRINGQHTCWARISMPKGFACEVRRLVYRVPNEAELKKLYGVFDPAYSARSVNHLTRMLLNNTAATEGIAISTVGYLATGFKFWFWEKREEFRRAGHNEVSGQILKNPELFKMVANFYTPYTRVPHIFHRQAVIAAMFECWDKKPTIAPDFWKPVCDGLGLTEETDARYALMRWLQSHGVDAGGPNRDRTIKAASAEEMYRVCINAWNRWRAGEKVMAGLRTTQRRFNAK
jgi:hypothetical protein